MDTTLSADQQAFEQRVQAYLLHLMDPQLHDEISQPQWAEGGGPEFRRCLAQMGADGWIGLSWPESLGGRALSPIDQYLFTNAVVRSGFPYPFLTTESIAPTLAQHGSGRVRDRVVEEIRRGEAVVAIGYSEPGAGTDLASLTTRAERDGDGWLINGHKIWTSLGNFADYIWLAARTDSDASKRHRGITLFLVPTDSEGFSCTPIHTLGVRTNATYYDNLRLSDDYRVGDVNGGWKLITSQLNRERLSLVTHGQVWGLYDEVCQWAAQEPVARKQTLLDQPWVQATLARVRTGLEALRLICLQQAWAMQQESLSMADASVAKVYGTEFFVECYRALLEVLGQAGTLRAGSPGAVLAGKLEHRYRCGSILTFGGGTNEVQREIIAGAGLFLPRAR